MSKLKQAFGEEWYELLEPMLKLDYFQRVGKFVMPGKFSTRTIYPEDGDFFKPFRLCPPSKLKVVLLGSAPHPHSNGLAWSGKDYINPYPPGLETLLKECENDIHDGFKLDQDPDLTRWAEQGVLLLNPVLTAEKGCKFMQHHKVWNKFTRHVLEKLSDSLIATTYVLWGDYNGTFIDCISKETNFILTNKHTPVDGEVFLGKKPFSKANEVIVEVAKTLSAQTNDWYAQQIKW